MRKRTIFFTIFLCLQGLLYAKSTNPSGNPEPKIVIETPCNLGAPANISWSFPTSTTVLVSWTSVPGAWGYWANLTGTSSTQGGVTQSTSMLFTTVPNQVYTFTVGSMCDENTYSPYHNTVLLPTYIVITDILVDLASPCSKLVQVQDLYPISNFTIDYQSDVTKDYFLRFQKNGAPYDMYFKRVNTTPPNPMNPYKFQLKTVFGQGSQLDCSGNPLLNCQKPHFSGGGAQAYVQMARVVQASAIDQIVITGNTFDSFALYYCEKDSLNGGGSSRNAYGLAPHSYVVSPFHDYLQIGLDTSKRLRSIRMMDISGRLTYEQIMPDNLEFSDQLILPTEQLARGLYILQLQSNDGKVEVFKVVKE